MKKESLVHQCFLFLVFNRTLTSKIFFWRKKLLPFLFLDCKIEFRLSKESFFHFLPFLVHPIVLWYVQLFYEEILYDSTKNCLGRTAEMLKCLAHFPSTNFKSKHSIALKLLFTLVNFYNNYWFYILLLVLTVIFMIQFSIWLSFILQF